MRRHQSSSSRSNDRSSSRRGRANWNVVSRLGKVSFSPFVPPKVVVLPSMSTLPPRFFGLREPSWTLPCVCYVSVSLSYTSLEIVLLICVIDSPEELANKIGNEGPKGPIMRDLRRMKRVSFFCKHRQRDSEVQRKSYSIEGFEQNAKDYTFELRRPNTEGGFTSAKITAFDYFLKQYNMRLKYPLLPLVKTRKKGEVFPMELAHIVEVCHVSVLYTISYILICFVLRVNVILSSWTTVRQRT